MTRKILGSSLLLTNILCMSLIAQVTGTGTKGTVPLWAGSWSIGNSLIRQKNGDIAIGTNAPQAKLHVQITTGTAVAGYTGVVVFRARTLQRVHLA